MAHHNPELMSHRDARHRTSRRDRLRLRASEPVAGSPCRTARTNVRKSLTTLKLSHSMSRFSIVQAAMRRGEYARSSRILSVS